MLWKAIIDEPYWDVFALPQLNIVIVVKQEQVNPEVIKKIKNLLSVFWWHSDLPEVIHFW